ncbi:sensor histidine kinase [Primorskyibacter sp. S87]|uniref:sensor histidine kinase n=1 Tax=Primorskyibacter sp. S87 TaxID=3415126 RepID=UPI003C7991D8
MAQAKARYTGKRLVAGWVLTAFVAIAALGLFHRNTMLSSLEQESAILHRLVSQRVGQHDAHLTSLSAIATAGDMQRPDLFLGVAATISRFYPRITEVQLVPLNPAGEIIGTRSLSPETAAKIREAALRSTGVPEIVGHPDQNAQYMLVKRSPNTEAAIYALMLSIDAAQLIESESEFWLSTSSGRQLLFEDGSLLHSSSDPGANTVTKPLASPSQPLLLRTGIRIEFADLVSPLRALGAIILVSAVYFIVLSGLRQRARTRLAEREAALSRVEAQLAHASRVNVMGEMASGMAHELTQPLTAILAQAQAGRHLLKNGDLETLEPTLDNTVAQARRASAILERLRNWTRPSTSTQGPADLRLALANVTELLTPEANQRGLSLSVTSPAHPVEVKADLVELEQVLHNLIRNALEALDGQSDGEVRVSADMNGDQVVIEIADNGPGVPEDLVPNLFTPFVTTREDGSGLGLALSQRLVEKSGGEIILADNRPHSGLQPSPTGDRGAVFRVVLPIANFPAEPKT